MLAVLAGLPLGFLSFLVTANLVSNFLGAGIPLMIGLAAGWLTWRYFKALDERRLADLLNPPAQLWPLTMPSAWGVIKDAFDGPIIMCGPGGLVPWRILKEDRSRGLIIACLNFRELVQPTEGQSDPSGIISVTAQLTPQADGTLVALTYNATGEQAPTEQLVRLTQRWLQEDLERLSSLEPG